MNNITLQTKQITVKDFLSLPKSVEQDGSKRSNSRKYETYVPEAFGTVLLGKWANGDVYRYNGNGRVSEFLKRGDLKDTDLIGVQVVEIKDAAHSTKVWQASNDTLKVTPTQKLNALIAAGDPETTTAVKLAEAYGLKSGSATDAQHITLDSMVRIYRTGDYADAIYQIILAVKLANQGHNVRVLVEELPNYYTDDLGDVVIELQDNLVIDTHGGTNAKAKQDTQQKVRGILSKFSKKK